MKEKNYNSVDLVKFLCSILIVAIHITPLGSSSGVGIVNDINFFIQNYLARIAVPFFFVSSGFFLYRKSAEGSFKLNSTKKYVLRLLKLYVIWSLIYFPLAIKDLLIEGKSMVHALILYVRNFIFAGSYMQLWYLNATIVAVLIVSFLLYRGMGLEKITIFALILYIVGLFAQSWFGFIIPVREAAQGLWSLLRFSKNIIVTTRNGLFEGVLFIGIGMLFAYRKIQILKGLSLIGFCISMICMFVEVSLLSKFGYAREYDMYLFLIPITVFWFSYIRQIELVDKPIYRVLRKLSSLVFYLHMWVNFIVESLMRLVCKPLLGTSWVFIITLVCTIILSLAVIRLSKFEKLKWLNKLYA